MLITFDLELQILKALSEKREAATQTGGRSRKERDRGKRVTKGGRERSSKSPDPSKVLLRIHSLVSSCLPESGQSYLLNAELISCKFIREPAPNISVEGQKAVALGLVLNLPS